MIFLSRIFANKKHQEPVYPSTFCLDTYKFVIQPVWYWGGNVDIKVEKLLVGHKFMHISFHPLSHVREHYFILWSYWTDKNGRGLDWGFINIHIILSKHDHHRHRHQQHLPLTQLIMLLCRTFLAPLCTHCVNFY